MIPLLSDSVTDVLFTLDSGDPVAVALRATASILVACTLSSIVAVTYRATHTGMQYSRSLTMSLVLVSCVGTLVMLVIGDSMARAFGVFGALSIVRFRTAVKDPRDIAFVFLALGLGMAAGTGRFILAAVGTGLICLIIGLLGWVRFGARSRDDYLLRIVYSGDATSLALTSALAGHSRRAALLTLQGFDGDGGVEATWLVGLTGDVDKAIRTLQAVPGVRDVQLTATREEIEL